MIDFKGHRFEQDIIPTGVRWYLAYPLSDRNLEERLAERGVDVTVMSGDHSARLGIRHPFLAKPFDLDRLQALLDAHGVYPMKREVVVRPESSEEKKPCTVVCFS